MEDFREAHNKVIKLQNAPEPQTGFIASRLNKDNLFNVLFFLGMSGGYNLASFLKIQPASSIIALVTTFAMVFMVKRNASITFDKEKMEFIHSNGSRSKNNGIGLIFLILGSFFLSSVFIGLIGNNLLISKIIACSAFFILPVLYCIARNLPIAVYFKKEAWTSLELTGGASSCSGGKRASNNSNSFASSHRTSSMRTSAYSSSSHKSYSGSSRGSIITSPTNRSYSSNIFNR